MAWAEPLALILVALPVAGAVDVAAVLAGAEELVLPRGLLQRAHL